MEVEEILFTDLCKAIQLLDNIDSMGMKCSTQQSQIDSELSDWLHMIQHQDLDDTELIKVGKKIKELRIQREHYNNLWELLKIYNEGRGRLIDKGNREFLLNKIKSKYKNFNQEYNNRILDKEKMQEVLGDDTKVKMTNNEKKQKVKELLENKPGLSNTEIHKITGISPITIAKYRKEIE